MVSYLKRRIPRSIRKRTLLDTYGCHPNCPHLHECMVHPPRCKHHHIRNGGLF